MSGAPLDAVRAWVARFVKTTSEHDLDLIALWIAHTHLLAQVQTSPRLIIASPFPGAGKTTLLEHVQALTPRPVFASNALTPSVTANLASEGRTILIDEADKHVGRDGGESRQVLLGIVNAGYKRSGTYVVNVPDESSNTGWRPADVPVFGALAMAGISPDLPADTLSRAVTVRLLPDVEDSVEETDWELIEDEAQALHERLSTWVGEVTLEKGEALPDGVAGRLREVWRPLMRVAMAAGGDWPERATHLAERHRDELAQQGEESLMAERPHVVLIRDIYGVWPGEEEYAATVGLLEDLHRYSPDTWGDRQGHGRAPLTVQRMGRMLSRNYGITSSRQSGDGPRGYWRHDFGPAWAAIGFTGTGWLGAERESAG